MHTRLGWIVGIGVVGIIVASFGVVHAQTKPIKIGQIIPMTGEAAESGKYHKQGAEIAIDKINAAGGINGKSSRSSSRTTRPPTRAGWQRSRSSWRTRRSP